MKKGFTLIELLVVITILAVLAGAALPYVQNYVDESRIAKAKTDLEEIARALVVYETREGDYGETNVSGLTGRYLDRSPIDPWGSPYVVDPEAGIVYSKGPDRLDSAIEDKYDNINAPYQPPLALVSAKWVDRNQSGAVDIQNVTDELHLTFSRKFADASVFNSFASQITVTTSNAASGLLSAIVDTLPFVVASRTLVYRILSNEVFVAGRDSVLVNSGHGTIKDRATPSPNFCISDQNVVILAQ